MKKLIKFISLTVSLTAILTSNFSLAAMTTDMEAQTHILTKLYAGTPVPLAGNRIECKDNRIFVYSLKAQGFTEDVLKRTSFELLEQQGLVAKILVDTQAYELMESNLQFNLHICECMLSHLNLKDCAQKLVSEFRDKPRLKEFTTQILSCLNVQHPSYGSTFLLAYIFRLNRTGSFILEDSTKAGLCDELIKLNQAVYFLVNQLIQLKKQSFEQAGHPGERTPLLNHAKSELDDSFVAAGTAIIARSLLLAINALI